MRSGQLQRSFPLLCALLKQNPSEVFMTAHSSSTEGTAENANIELSTISHFSDERHCKSQQMERSLYAQNYETTRSQNVDHSGGIHSTLGQLQVASPSLNVQPSTDNVKDYSNVTDAQIQDLIVQWVAAYSTDNHDMGTDPAPQSDSIMPKSSSAAHLTRTDPTNKDHYEGQRLKYAVTEQCTTSYGQVFEEDHSHSSKSNAGLTPKSRKMTDCATSALKKHSTEYQQITGKVAATCPKNEDESPVVLTTVPGITMDEWTERQPSSSLNKNLDEIYQMPGVSRAVTHMPETEKGDAGLKPVEAVGLDNVQGVTDVSVDFQTRSSSVVSKNNAFKFTSLIENQNANAKKKKSIEDQHFDVTSREMIVHSDINLAVDKIQIHNVVSMSTNPREWLKNHRSHEGARKDMSFVHSKTDVSIAHSDTKALLMSVVKDPQYEDISDDEGTSQLATKLIPCYEDISEDENPQNEDVALERPSLVQEPEPNNKQLPFVNETYGCVQMCAQMKSEVTSDEQLISNKHISPETETLDVAERCSCQWLVETDDCFEDLLCLKCDCKSVRHLGGQTSHSVSHSPSSVLKDEYETDDQMDDEWIVIPISMSDVRFEPEDEDQDSPEKDVSHYASLPPVSPSSSTSPVSASASCQEVEVFDTYDSFFREKAVPLQNTFQVTSDCSTPEHELDYEGEPNTLQSRRELYSDPEDSCETEDSCDYSPGSGNIMTVSREYLKKRSVSLSPERDNSVTEKEGEKDRRRKTCERLKQLIAACAAFKQKEHKKTNMTLESDTESDKNRKMKAKGKRLFPSGSDNSGDAECSQQKRHIPETVDSPCGTVSEFQRNSRPPAGSPPQQLSKLTNIQSKEVMQDPHLESDVILVSDTEDENDLIGNQEETEKSGQLIEAICDSEHVQHNRQKISEKQSDVIILSDTEDENDQNGKEEEIEKSGQVYEVKSGSEHVQHKTNKRKRKEEERRNAKGIPSSGSLDSGDALPATKKNCSTEIVDTLSGTANKKPKNPRLSSEDLKEKQPQYVDLKVDSVLGPNPVVPHPLFHKSSHPTEYVKDSEVHMRSNDETQAPESPKGTGRNTDSREKNMPDLHSNKKKFKPDLVNDRCHLTKTGTAKSCLVSRPSRGAPSTSNCSSSCTRGQSSETISRQLSLPSHGAPSTSNCSLSSASGQISEARQSSACSRGLSIPRHWSPSRPPLPRSYSSPSTLVNPGTPTKRPSSSATREKVIKDWNNSFILTRRDRRSNLRMKGHLRTTNYDSKSETSPESRTMSDDSENEGRLELGTTNNTSWHETRRGPRTTNNYSRNEARPGTSRRNRALRQRHESTTPLMKRAKIDAIEWTKATHRDISGKQRSSVGDHYKWSDKATANNPRKGFGR